MKLKKLIKVLHGEAKASHYKKELGDLEIEGIAYDSREVKPGYIFVAHKGTAQDSHDYVADAIKHGASFLVLERALQEISLSRVIVKDSRRALAILAQNFYGNPSQQLKVIGVTGTFGKTTSTWLLKSIYEASGARVGLLGTIEYWIGSERRPATHTTPESLDLQKLFSEMLKKQVAVVVFEVSSHSLALSRVYGVDFDIACFTRMGWDHLDFHHTLIEYEAAKLKLFSSLKTSALAVLNRDDSSFSRFKESTNARVVTYGFTSESDVKGELLSSTLTGLEAFIKWNNSESKIVSPLIGSHNLANILLASACALNDGVNFAAVSQGIRNLTHIPGRFEAVERVIVDYAHTPASLEAALRSAREFTRGRLICIFGCGGDRDAGKRPKMGKVASELANHVILTTDNPRSEEPKKIIADIVKGIPTGNYEVILDRREAIKSAVERSSPEDVILLAGKGHEGYQIYGENKLPWDEKQVVKEILEQGN